MRPSFKTLQKILRQEQKFGYTNKAVIGGLERFANNWLNMALKETGRKEDRLQIEQIVIRLKKYGRATPEERQLSLAGILQELEAGPQAADAQPAAPSGPQTDAPSSPPPAEKPAPPPPRPQSASLPPDGLQAPVTRLPGIKEAYATKLNKLGVQSVGDLLTLYPRRYDDYRSLKTIHQLEYGETVTIIAQIWQTRTKTTRSNRPLVTSILSDGTGTIEATWFNQPWLEKKLAPGRQIVISGQVQQYLGRLIFQSPEWEMLDKTLIHTGRLAPVYPLTSGITAQWLRKLQKRTIDYWANRLPDPLPEAISQRHGLMALSEATRQIHFPDNWETLKEARRRLAFDELLLLQLGVLRQRQTWQARPGIAIAVNRPAVEAFIAALPFALTQAQQKTLAEILADIGRPVAMSRLLQGDVGSGKTVVALAAMLAAIKGGGQTAILAPTEILAEQHYKGMHHLLDAAGYADKIDIRFLTGSTKSAERKAILADLAAGQVDLLVGTHAVIQRDVVFNNLQLAVVDEQHRFGVEQRGLLRQKGQAPHMLVMSATPIPRTLALTLYGDLDISIIDQMPAGRQSIKTHWLAANERERAYAFLRTQIEKGRQAFVICPLVEESDKIEAKSAVEEHERLQKTIFPNLKLGLLHGRMKGKEKEAVMTAFRNAEIQILVSTSVVEVGIDIPNATTILIEGANRFGLAQLHQFRGRVGRGAHQSYCLLVADNAGPEAEARLKVMTETNDGFALAEEDLKLRGPGEFFGTKQSGLPSLKLVKLSDTKLLELARREAQSIFEADPTLTRPEHRLLANNLNAFWTKLTEPS